MWKIFIYNCAFPHIMTSRTLTNEQKSSLDFQTDQLYESLKRAVNTQVNEDTIWVYGLLKTFGKSLDAATNHSGFRNWSRTSLRTALFDKYFLQYLISENAAIAIKNVTEAKTFSSNKYLLKAEETNVNAEVLKQKINNHSTSYSTITSISLSLGKAQKFNELIDVLDYVREKYQDNNKSK
jgi:hypothetical protein